MNIKTCFVAFLLWFVSTNSYAFSIQSYNGSSPYFLKPYHTGNAIVKWSAVDTLFFDVYIAQLELASISPPGPTKKYYLCHWITKNKSGEKWYSIWTNGPIILRYAGVVDGYIVRVNPVTKKKYLHKMMEDFFWSTNVSVLW